MREWSLINDGKTTKQEKARFLQRPQSDEHFDKGADTAIHTQVDTIIGTRFEWFNKKLDAI
jgi:tellurite resistance protein